MKPLIILLLSTLPISFGSSKEIISIDASLLQPPPPLMQAANLKNPPTLGSSYFLPFFKSTEENDKHSILYVVAIPDSPENGLDGLFYDSSGHQSYLRIKIMTSAKKGRANNAIIKLLAHRLKIDTSQISIISGEKEYYKQIKVSSPIYGLAHLLEIAEKTHM